eukprot:TRINITY_DN25816_c0_g1_i1.p1 TRINITY_DN25816_c0_g1~~TRINITY_DN25816_c0_g1_i1.p1  ORF type:complete len:347 (+),score=100.50 TRINITY_DN25816_c0_g1_i1:289-1329(+)
MARLEQLMATYSEMAHEEQHTAAIQQADTQLQQARNELQEAQDRLDRAQAAMDRAQEQRSADAQAAESDKMALQEALAEDLHVRGGEISMLTELRSQADGLVMHETTQGLVAGIDLLTEHQKKLQAHAMKMLGTIAIEQQTVPATPTHQPINTGTPGTFARAKVPAGTVAQTPSPSSDAYRLMPSKGRIDIIIKHILRTNPGADENRLRNGAVFGVEGQLHSWDLSFCNLQSLPESFGTVRTSGDLMLHDNKMESLPESFGCIRVGGNLIMNNNLLSSLPESFGSISVGGHLALNENPHLEKLPSSFGEMNVGGNLFLSGHRLSIQEIPVDFPNVCGASHVRTDDL